MTLFYAVGGGMGHVSRSLSLARQLSIDRFKIITALDTAERIVPRENLILIDVSFQERISALRQHLSELIASLSPSRIYIDSFPLGIMGELESFIWPLKVRLAYVARLVQWGKYRRMYSERLPSFDEVIIIEDLYEKHLNDLQEIYKVRFISIGKEEVKSLSMCDTSYGVICHSGNEQELNELCSYALEIKNLRKSGSRLFLISTQKPKELCEGIEWQSSGLARQYFNKAEFIVTACGFNLMNECQPYKDKHYFIPLERKFDDQFYRAKKHRCKTESS